MVRLAMVVLALWLPLGPAAAQAPPAEGAVFATLGEVTITEQEYLGTFSAAVRGKYYHGQVPDAELQQFAREVGTNLVNHYLLLAEAERRRIEPDEAWVQERMRQFVARNQDREVWREHEAEIRPEALRQLRNQSRLGKLEALVRDIPAPDDRAVAEYYAANPDKFTQPEQIRVGLVLLKVDPGAPLADWEARLEQGRVLREQIRQGVPFETVAREHSEDVSAENGGDMGYLHQGMLGEIAQKVLDELDDGAVSEPARLLEGIALFKLIHRKQPQLMALDEVRERARNLLRSERQVRAWEGLIAALREATPIEINEAVFARIGSTRAQSAQQPAAPQ